jgi:hypothetical protein
VVGRALATLFVTLAIAPNAAAALPGGRAITVTTSLTPDTHLFADPVHAQIDVVVDPGLLDPDRLRLRVDFAPYETVVPPSETHRSVGSLVRIRYSAQLRCLHIGCLGPRFATELGAQEAGRPERHAIHFRPVDVLLDRTGGEDELLLRRAFPPVEVIARVNAAGLEAEQQGGALLGYRASLEPPRPTYRVRPHWLAGALFALAGLILLLPVSLGARALHARWRSRRELRRLSPLERALLLVDQASVDDLRQALEALAQVLDDGARPLAASARAVAWDARPPERGPAVELAGRVRDAFSGGGRPA